MATAKSPRLRTYYLEIVVTDVKLPAFAMKVRVERKAPDVRPITVENGIVTENTWVHHLEVSGKYERNVVRGSLQKTCNDSGGVLELTTNFDDEPKAADEKKPYEVTITYSDVNAHWVKHAVYGALDGLPILSHMGNPNLV